MNDVDPNNISEWIRDNEVRVISDIEGGNLKDFVKKNNEIKYSGQIIVTGDLIDSTVSSPPYANFKSLSFNIRNLIECTTNQKIRYVLGNRDLNKIKVFHLTTLKYNVNVNDVNVVEFNNGTINNLNLSKAYNNLKEKFFYNQITYNSTMDNWYTFWSGGLGSRDWSLSISYNTNFPFLQRFNNIFGTDNTTGTMSADKLLHTIPHELFPKIFKIPTNITEINIDDDYKAFIVLYVFRIMLMERKTQSTTNIYDS